MGYVSIELIYAKTKWSFDHFQESWTILLLAVIKLVLGRDERDINEWKGHWHDRVWNTLVALSIQSNVHV